MSDDRIHNEQFAECEVLENYQGLCCPRTRTRTKTCKLVLEDLRGQGLSSRTTTLNLNRPIQGLHYINYINYIQNQNVNV